MSFWLFLPLVLTCSVVVFWLYTLLYIKRGIFMTNKEKDRWFNTVVSGSMTGLILFWTKGRKKRIA